MDMLVVEAEELLNLTGEYTSKDLQHAYRSAVHQYHPDANINSDYDYNSIMSDINSAYGCLKQLFASGATVVSATYYPGYSDPIDDLIDDDVVTASASAVDNMPFTSAPATSAGYDAPFASSSAFTTNNGGVSSSSAAPAQDDPDTSAVSAVIDDIPAWQLFIFNRFPFGLLIHIIISLVAIYIFTTLDFSTANPNVLVVDIEALLVCACLLVSFACWITGVFSSFCRWLILKVCVFFRRRFARV